VECPHIDPQNTAQSDNTLVVGSNTVTRAFLIFRRSPPPEVTIPTDQSRPLRLTVAGTWHSAKLHLLGVLGSEVTTGCLWTAIATFLIQEVGLVMTDD
jgi:hypothetical protein